MICNNCGQENIDTAVYCESCGAQLTPAAPVSEVGATTVLDANTPIYTAAQTQYTPPQPQYVPPQNQYTPPQPRPVQATPYNNYAPVATPATSEIPPEYKPLSGWAYFGWQLLFAIPVVGFILLIVFACGGTRNINLRNFARSYFCALLIGVILFVLSIVLALVFGASLGAIMETMMSRYEQTITALSGMFFPRLYGQGCFCFYRFAMAFSRSFFSNLSRRYQGR